MESRYDALRLNNQLCFPLYLCAKEVVSRYVPLLKDLDLTYTQYLVMMVLWEEEECSVKRIGERLSLDSGTLTPLLKKLENRGLAERRRSDKDERVVLVRLSKEGEALQEKALIVPEQMAACFDLSEEEAITLYGLLNKVISRMEESRKEI